MLLPSGPYALLGVLLEPNEIGQAAELKREVFDDVVHRDDAADPATTCAKGSAACAPFQAIEGSGTGSATGSGSLVSGTSSHSDSASRRVCHQY